VSSLWEKAFGESREFGKKTCTIDGGMEDGK